MPPASVPAASARLPAAARAALWTVLSALCIVSFASIAKHLSDALPLPVVVFFRALFGVIFLLPWLMRNGLGGLRTRRPALMASRGINTIIGLYLLFGALALMPLADVVAILYSKPIFASLAAVLILGEVLHRHRVLALAAGIIGMAVIIRPGFADINYGVLLALGAMASGAYTTITVKFLTRTETPDAIVAWGVSVMLAASVVPAALFWQTPDAVQLLWLMALGGLANGFQRCMTRAFAAADATVVMGFEFSRLIFAALAGYILFGETSDGWTWAGGTIIFAAGLYMVRRESGR